MIEVRKTKVFNSWLSNLKDERALAKISTRIDRVALGNFGDVKFFGGIGELRIDYGPGYRVYFVQRGAVVVVLLCGGDKSTQSKDIDLAKELADGL